MSISLSNGHARATVLSAVWSPADQQLVAVLMAATDKTVLTALKAELEKNNKNSFVALAGDASAELAGARRGYVHLSASLEKTNAQGHVMVLLHWRAHDPRHVVTSTKPADPSTGAPPAERQYFYVVARQGDCMPSLFIDRMQLALPWALRPEWAEPLLKLGREAELVDCLSIAVATEIGGPLVIRQVAEQSYANPTPARSFQGALRVIHDEDRWGDVIGSALADGVIQL